MAAESTSRSKRRAERWAMLVENLLTDCGGGNARAQTYWAQQLAFGPVLIYALGLRLRRVPLSVENRQGLIDVVRLAVSGLGSLPEAPGRDPHDLLRLARRQASALASGRRSRLQRLLALLDPGSTDRATDLVVPDRMLRPYPLIGWTDTGAGPLG